MFRGEKRGPVTLLLSLALVLAMASAAAATGTIKGTISSKDGKPLAYANVILVGTNLGAMSLADGKFTINGVPAGNYTVRAMMMGYKQVEKPNVAVSSGSLTLDFTMEQTIVAKTQEIIVTADKPMVEVTSSDVRGTVVFAQEDNSLRVEVPVQVAKGSKKLFRSYFKPAEIGFLSAAAQRVP